MLNVQRNRFNQTNKVWFQKIFLTFWSVKVSFIIIIIIYKKNWKEIFTLTVFHNFWTVHPGSLYPRVWTIQDLNQTNKVRVPENFPDLLKCEGFFIIIIIIYMWIFIWSVSLKRLSLSSYPHFDCTDSWHTDFFRPSLDLDNDVFGINSPSYPYLSTVCVFMSLSVCGRLRRTSSLLIVCVCVYISWSKDFPQTWIFFIHLPKKRV